MFLTAAVPRQERRAASSAATESCRGASRGRVAPARVVDRRRVAAELSRCGERRGSGSSGRLLHAHRAASSGARLGAVCGERSDAAEALPGLAVAPPILQLELVHAGGSGRGGGWRRWLIDRRDLGDFAERPAHPALVPCQGMRMAEMPCIPRDGHIVHRPLFVQETAVLLVHRCVCVEQHPNDGKAVVTECGLSKFAIRAVQLWRVLGECRFVSVLNVSLIQLARMATGISDNEKPVSSDPGLCFYSLLINGYKILAVTRTWLATEVSQASLVFPVNITHPDMELCVVCRVDRRATDGTETREHSFEHICRQLLAALNQKSGPQVTGSIAIVVAEYLPVKWMQVLGLRWIPCSNFEGLTLREDCRRGCTKNNASESNGAHVLCATGASCPAHLICHVLQQTVYAYYR